MDRQIAEIEIPPEALVYAIGLIPFEIVGSGASENGVVKLLFDVSDTGQQGGPWVIDYHRKMNNVGITFRPKVDGE
jgi:hypothetical protein